MFVSVGDSWKIDQFNWVAINLTPISLPPFSGATNRTDDGIVAAQ